MYRVSDTIKTQQYDQLQIQKLIKNNRLEILSISLEKDALFPEHTSPTDAVLVVLEGNIDFHINGENFCLKAQQHFSFPKETAHWVKANENAKFLVIR
jgi:quercetin dioxygenase-like cupin family protein